MVAVFLLYVAYLCPEETHRDDFHVGLERRGYYGAKKHDRGSLRWFRVSQTVCLERASQLTGQIIWALVFQLVPVTIILFPVQYIVVQVICPLDSRLETAEMTLAALQFVTTAVAWNAIFIYYRRTKSQLRNHRGSRKLNAFQSLVGLQSIQALIFPLVTQASSYYPTKYVSYEDFSSTIPAFMTCWESLIFAILFLQVFSFTPYRNAVLEDLERPATVGRAVKDTLNQMDIVKGTWYLFQIIFHTADRADSEDMSRLRIKQGRYDNVAAYESEVELRHSEESHSHILQKLNSQEA